MRPCTRFHTETYDIVTQVLKEVDEFEEGIQRCSLSSLCEKITSCFGVKVEELRSSSNKKGAVEAKAAFSFLALKKMGYSGREVGDYLNMRSYSAIRSAERGGTVVDNKALAWDIGRE
jgi:chromosomal replication initiation ATPase DnaA